MRKTPEHTLVYCGGKPFYRRNPRGLCLWCRSHHREQVVAWEEMHIPVDELRRLLAEAEKDETTSHP